MVKIGGGRGAEAAARVTVGGGRGGAEAAVEVSNVVAEDFD